MSAVIEEKKRINAEVPMSLYKDIEAAGYTIKDAIIEGWKRLLDGKDGNPESDCDQYKKEAENLILAAESKLVARDSQIKHYNTMIAEKDAVISKLNTRLQKFAAPKVKTWPNYLLGIRTPYLRLIGIGFSMGLLVSALFCFYIYYSFIK